MNRQSLSKYLFKIVGVFVLFCFVVFFFLRAYHTEWLLDFSPQITEIGYTSFSLFTQTSHLGKKVMTRKYVCWRIKFVFQQFCFCLGSKGDKCVLSWFSFFLTIYLVGEFPWMLRMWNAPKQSQRMRDYAFCNLLPLSELRGNKKYDVSGTAGSVPWPSPAWLLQPGTLILLSKGLFSFAPGSSTLAGYPE